MNIWSWKELEEFWVVLTYFQGKSHCNKVFWISGEPKLYIAGELDKSYYVHAQMMSITRYFWTRKILQSSPD